MCTERDMDEIREHHEHVCKCTTDASPDGFYFVRLRELDRCTP